MMQPHDDRPAARRRSTVFTPVMLAFLALCAAFYTFPLWTGMKLHEAVFEQDRLHHENILLFLNGEMPSFDKYGIGIHLIDWVVVHTMYSLLDRSDFPDDQRITRQDSLGFFHYRTRTAHLAAWFHAGLMVAAVALFASLAGAFLSGPARWVAVAVFALHPAMPLFAVNAGVNAPFLFGLVLSLWTLDRWRRRRTFGAAAAAGAVAGFAFIAKEYAALVFAVYPLVFYQHARVTGVRFLTRRLIAEALAAAGVFVVFVVTVNLVWYDPQLYLGHLVAYFSDDPAIAGEARMTFWVPRAGIARMLPDLVGAFRAAAFSPVWAALALVGAFLALPRRHDLWLFVLPFIPYALLVPVRYGVAFYPYLFPVLISVAFCGAWAWQRLLASRPPWGRRVAIVLAVLAIGHLSVTAAFVWRDAARDPRLLTRNYLRSVPCRPAFTVGIIGALELVEGAYGCGRGVSLSWSDLAAGRPPLVAPDFLVVTRAQWEPLPGAAPARKVTPDQIAARLLGRSDYRLVAEFANRRRCCRFVAGRFNDDHYVFAAPGVSAPPSP